MTEKILQVLNGVDSIKLEMASIQSIEKILYKIGFIESKTEYDQNGWQVDFWYNYTHEEKGVFVLSGSLHYGNFHFSKKD